MIAHKHTLWVPAFLLAALLLTLALHPTAFAAPRKDQLVSTSAVLMDADTGEVLYSKNRSKKMYPASITKIMTGLLTVEGSDLAGTATASAAAAKIPRGHAHIALQKGDTIGLDDAMYATMLASANDAANVLAEHAGGSRSEFVRQMNERAAGLGATKTQFANPTGIHSKKHYTTAYDMALITREASRNKTFLRYFGASAHTLPALNSQTRETEIKNAQYMLQQDREEYDPAVIGGKIGYTPQAGHTMCTVAERDGRRLVCVVMGSTSGGKYEDTRLLLDYGFALPR